MNREKHFVGCVGELVSMDDLSVIRPNYSRHNMFPKTVADIKATLRAGPYAWPGGYPLFAITDDGTALCFACLRAEFRSVADSVANDLRDGWKVTGIDINYDEPDLCCAHCSKAIESAYDETNDPLGKLS